ncbi:Bax inhibitor-1/YccA family protein [Cellulomonas bogoriensis]|uniref:Membrane protein n=1 Tax=Cellulomonas bogoriensis 69B4 = DSM 16987 TaxID=1386082 RepID=A0A0A0BNX3_9CELL|nr:Bax inhibitor-1/YccA family protein [Cellulomonas bogoriensis]KGM09656.1 membrane protein [Cellulomonas bogoriensis 69B4 = DSM 16987]
MSNPVFNHSPVFGEPRRGRGAVQHAPYPGTTGGGSTTGALEDLYSAPSATPRDTGRLTYDDVIMKTAGLFGVLVVVAALTWTLAPGLFVVGLIAGFVLGLINYFKLRKGKPSPALITAYAVSQGVFLGGLSAIFEALYPGIVVQAVLATFITFAVCLTLFKSGKVRVTPKFRRIMLVGMISYLAFALVNVGLMLFTDIGGFGLRSEVTVLGIPLGVLVGAVAVLLASMALITDFDMIKKGVDTGAPARIAWSAAFGLMVTLVWLYVEFLRILAILRGNN